MTPPPLTILVVADLAEQPELIALLRRAGDPLDRAELVTGCGDDDTLGQFLAASPPVVVMRATLAEGDARTLIGAMREACDERGTATFVVLLGDDQRGPVINALDAVDFGIDRFVAWPFAPNAVRFAVATGVARTAAPVPARPEVETGWDEDPDHRDEEQQARRHRVAAELLLAEELDLTDQEIDDGSEDVGGIGDPAPVASPWRPGSTEVPSDPGDALAGVSPGAEWGRRYASPAAFEEPVPIDAWGGRDPTHGADYDEEVLRDVGVGVDDDLSVDITRDPAPSREVSAFAPSTTGGDFARELRRKMSLMAERLFRGDAPVAIGPSHDHRTEFDLGDFVAEPRHAESYDGGVTFAAGVGGVGDALLRQVTEPRGTAEAGELRPGDTDAAGLLARMFTTDFTGRIHFGRDAVEKVIHFEGGRPVFASSNLVDDRMSELLHREGKITDEQRARAREIVRETGRRMGEVLVERGFLKRRELLPAVRRHVEDIIFSLFGWERGEYRVVAGDGASAERIRLSRHPAAVVLEGVRRKFELATLERLLGPSGTLVEITDRDQLAAISTVADLSAEERAAVAGFDGVSDLATVAARSGVSLLNVYQLAWSLRLLGLATARRPPGEDDDGMMALVADSDLAIDRERVRARYRLVTDGDYFAVLGVRRDATGFEIKRAFEAARRDFAAESFPPELRRELHAELDEIALVLDESFRVLGEAALRARYQRNLRDFVDEVA